MKPVYLERSHTTLPFLSLMTPLSGSRAIKPRSAFAKSALSDHGSDAVDFLLNSRVAGEAGLGSPAVCAWATVTASANASPAAVKLNEHWVEAPSSYCGFGRVGCVNVCPPLSQ